MGPSDTVAESKTMSIPKPARMTLFVIGGMAGCAVLVVATLLARLTVGPVHLGLSTDGTVDFAESHLDLAGCIIPVKWGQDVVGAIPLIGPVYAGSRGQDLVLFG